jgi:hypothetical protein
MTVNEMRAHVEALGIKHDVRIVWLPMDMTRSTSNTTDREVYVPPLTDSGVYAVVLHEIGHIVHPEGHGANFSNMHAEQSAWSWARATAKVWTPTMQQSMEYGLNSHRVGEASRDVLRAILAQLLLGKP